MNNIMITVLEGRICRQPELKYSAAGLAIASLSIVCNRSKKKGDEWEEVPNFFELTAFDKTAEHLAEKCSKGQKMTFQCEPKQDRWDDAETGKPRSKVTFVIQSYAYGEKARGEGDGEKYTKDNPGQGKASVTKSAAADGFVDDYPDEAPF